VLVAEDDPDMLAMLSEILAVEGYEVHGAADGGRLLVELTRGPECGYADGRSPPSRCETPQLVC
jgi:CheY-like chemotaxis protein